MHTSRSINIEAATADLISNIMLYRFDFSLTKYRDLALAIVKKFGIYFISDQYIQDILLDACIEALASIAKKRNLDENAFINGVMYHNGESKKAWVMSHGGDNAADKADKAAAYEAGEIFGKENEIVWGI